MSLIDNKLKFIAKTKKEAIKTLNAEFARLNKEYEDCRNTLKCYEKLIVDSLMYVTDRDNLCTSSFEGSHNSRLQYVLTLIKELESSNDKRDMKSVDPKTGTARQSLSEKIENMNNKNQTRFRDINLGIKECTNKMMSTMTIYTKKLNDRLDIISNQKTNLAAIIGELERMK